MHLHLSYNLIPHILGSVRSYFTRSLYPRRKSLISISAVANMMKAVVIYKAGPPEILKLEQRPIPMAKDGWVVIKVKAFGLNRSEVFTRQ